MSMLDPEKLTQHQLLIDEKIGDVTGDFIPDRVRLYGDKESDSPYITNLTLEIEDGDTGLIVDLITELSGYNPTLFLADFTKDQVKDIKLSMETGGSGGYGTFVLYSFMEDEWKVIFDSDSYNELYQYKVNYHDYYSVSIENVMFDMLFILDISDKGYDYVLQYYNVNGRLIKPIQGEVLALGSLIPVVTNEKDDYYDLLALQRIIGTTNSDTLGYIENLLSWDGNRFVIIRMMVLIPGLSPI